MLGLTKVVGEHELGVIFRLGRVVDPARGPGRVWMIPRVDQLVVVDMRATTIDIPAEEVMTKDAVPVTVSARVHAQVVAQVDAAVRVVNYLDATSQLTRAALRKVFQENLLDEVRFERTNIEAALQKTIDGATMAWGVTVSAIEIEVAAANHAQT